MKKTGKTLNKTKSKTKSPQKSKNAAKIALGLTGAAGASAAIGLLTKQNMELKKMVSNLQEEVGSYRRGERGETQPNFSWFGRPKPASEEQIRNLKRQLEEALVKNKELSKSKEACEKEAENVYKNFKLCDDKLRECNDAYKMLLKK